jgi:hypothetical protein
LKKLKDKYDHSKPYPSSGFVTQKHKLTLLPDEKHGTSVRVGNGLISVKYNFQLEQTSEEVKRAVSKGILTALRKEANDYLPVRLRELAILHGLHFSKLSIKNMRSRWGSCSGVNNINLTIHLMTLPERLIDYILLHELAHTKVKNHSKKYWMTLLNICPDAKHLDKELKSYKIMHY